MLTRNFIGEVSVKTIKGFKAFLAEMYQDLRDYKFNDRFDRDFGHYALNERPLRWDAAERKQCAEDYGNVDVGTVYLGGKIDDKQLYDKLLQLKPGEHFTLNLQSATPHKDTAISFMDYVKSYDEFTMLSQLTSNLERGSAGKFGAYLLTLKPTPNQVIMSTFGPTKKVPSHTAETECILYGDVKVLDVKIREVLTPETYQHILLSNFPDILESSFVSSWMEKKVKKIPNSFAKQLLEKIKTTEDVYTFLKKSLDTSDEADYVLNSLSFNDLVSNRLIKAVFDKNVSISSGSLVITIPGFSPFGVPRGSMLDNELKTIHKKNFVSTTKKEVSDLDHPFKVILTAKNFLLIDENGYDLISKLMFLKKSGVKPQHPILDKLNAINLELKDKMTKMVLSKKLSDYDENSIEPLENIFRSAKEIKDLKDILNPVQDYYNTGFSWFYNSFARGSSPSTRVFKIYREMLSRILSDF